MPLFGSSGKPIIAALAYLLLLLAACGLILSRQRVAIVLASGEFHQVAHKGTGTATLCQLRNGARVLRLTDFSTYAADELEVRLIAAADAFENDTVEQTDFISLGALQSVAGDQGYGLPEGADWQKYRAVVIWSRKHRVNFTTAPLKPH